MACYERPTILSLTTQDLCDLFGPTETQYFSVISTNPQSSGTLSHGQNIMIITNGTINVNSVSTDDVQIQNVGSGVAVSQMTTQSPAMGPKKISLPPATATHTSAISFSPGDSYNIIIVSTNIPNDTLQIEPTEPFDPGTYSVTVSAPGHEILSIAGHVLARYTFRFYNYVHNPDPTPTPTPEETPKTAD